MFCCPRYTAAKKLFFLAPELSTPAARYPVLLAKAHRVKRIVPLSRGVVRKASHLLDWMPRLEMRQSCALELPGYVYAIPPFQLESLWLLSVGTFESSPSEVVGFWQMDYSPCFKFL